MSKPTFLGPLRGKVAGQMELVNAESGAVLAACVEPAFDSKARKKGLLGRESIPDDYALIIAPCNAVHTFFMRTAIDLIYVARNGTVTKTCRSVKPWRISGAMSAFAVIETAAGFIDRTDVVPGEILSLRESENPSASAAVFSPAEVDQPRLGSALKKRLTPSHKRLTLADIVGCESPLQWYEAVAVVQEVSAAVLTRGPARDPRVPELSDIVLRADGGVELIADGPGHHSQVHRVSLVLLALTPEEQLPTQLRLLILEEVSPRPRLASLRDLHRELEFFERPNRREVVRGVFERFQQQLDPASAHAGVPAPLLEPPPPRRRHDWWKRRRVRVGALAALMLCAAAAGAWFWQRPEGRLLRSSAAEASRAASGMAQKVSHVAGDQWRAAQSQLGLTTPRAAPAAPPRTAVPEQAEKRNPPILQDTGTLPPVLPPVNVARVPLAGGANEPQQGGAKRADSSSGVPSSEMAVYSAQDSKVVPPVLLSPSLPANLRPWVRPENRTEVEVVVSAAGEVESVRLVSGQTSQTAMLLSAVKAWMFRPATLDGRAVRYRHRIRLPG